MLSLRMHRRTIGHGGSESAALWGEALLRVISTAIRCVRAWSVEAADFVGFEALGEDAGSAEA